MNRLFDKENTVALYIAMVVAFSWLVGGQVISARAGEEGQAAPEQNTAQGEGQNISAASQQKTGLNKEANPEASESKVMTEMEKKMQTIVTVDFRETPIDDVIKSLTQQADVDVVVSPQVTGNITATLTDVPLYDALDNILAVHGYGFMTTEKVVRIVPKAELAAQPVKLSTKIFHLDYAKMDETIKALKDVLSSRGRISSNVDTKHILITDTEDNMKLLDQFVEKMDQEIPQVLIEAQIYDVSSEASLDIGVNWYAGRLTFYDATTGAAVKYPVNSTNSLYGSSHTDPFVTGSFSSGITRASNTDALLRFGILNNHLDIDAVLEASQDNVNAKLLANPKILVLNGESANIKVIKEIPYQELTQTSGGGNIGTTNFKEVGVELNVTPYLTRENKIRMEIHPIFSAQTGSVPMPIIAGTSTISSLQPIVDTREALTHALVASGQTVVIGGLKKKDIVQEISKVPLLCDVPILGLLFRYKGETTINSELLVFITPRLISEPELSERETEQLENSQSEMCEPQQPVVSIDPCQR
jgi:type IV pilus assembly protein PilQ